MVYIYCWVFVLITFTHWGLFASQSSKNRFYSFKADVGQKYYTAAQNGDMRAFLTYFNQGYSPLISSREDGMTPFLIACKRGHSDICARILARYKSKAVREAYSRGFLLLHGACKQSHVSLCTLLLKNGAQQAIDQRDSDGMTPLGIACNNDDMQLCTLLIGAGADIDARQEGDLSLLSKCIKENNIQLFRFFVEQGASLRKKNIQEETPLIEALRLKRTRIVQYLLDEKIESFTQSLSHSSSKKNEKKEEVDECGICYGDQYLSTGCCNQNICQTCWEQCLAVGSEKRCPFCRSSASAVLLSSRN